eukprot:GFYU01042564.1.p1 GENE.GFYU01042564.1~~GFYU01042564.1.p1  ORF type:complete len:149 (+),score=42.18 GFYU01042564.1:49-495(+)
MIQMAAAKAAQESANVAPSALASTPEDAAVTNEDTTDDGGGGGGGGGGDGGEAGSAPGLVKMLSEGNFDEWIAQIDAEKARKKQEELEAGKRCETCEELWTFYHAGKWRVSGNFPFNYIWSCCKSDEQNGGGCRYKCECPGVVHYVDR